MIFSTEKALFRHKNHFAQNWKILRRSAAEILPRRFSGLNLAIKTLIARTILSMIDERLVPELVGSLYFETLILSTVTVTRSPFDTVHSYFSEKPSTKVNLYTCLPFHSTTYNDLVWKCGNRHWYKTPCQTPYLYEVMLKSVFHEIICTLIKQHPSIIKDCISSLNFMRESENAIDKNTIMEAVINYDLDSSNEQRIWRTVIQKVIVQPGHLLEFHMIDESKMKYRMMKISDCSDIPTQMYLFMP